MIRRAIPFVLLCLAIAPAQAQPVDTPIADCDALFKLAGQFERTPTTTIEDLDEGCHFGDVVLNFGPYSRFAVSDITLVGPDLMPALAAGRSPTSIDASFIGIRLSPSYAGSPLTTYIIEMQQDPYDVHVAMRWDQDSGVFDVADLSLKGRFLGSIALSARLSGVSVLPDNLDSIAPFDNVSLDRLTIDLDNKSLFTAFFAAPLVGLLPNDQDPKPLIAAAQQSVNAVIASLPDAQVSAETKTILKQFVEDFPRPFGHYTLEIGGVGGPLPFGTLFDLQSGFTDFAPILARLTLAASFADPAGLRIPAP